MNNTMPAAEMVLTSSMSFGYYLLFPQMNAAVVDYKAKNIIYDYVSLNWLDK
jgi:hypothetical protein